jgi:hypothetical protein
MPINSFYQTWIRQIKNYVQSIGSHKFSVHLAERVNGLRQPGLSSSLFAFHNLYYGGDGSGSSGFIVSLGLRASGHH